jgi:Ni/Fe-hydrogenase subunit HybB-like protein
MKMSAHETPMPIRGNYVTKGTLVLIIIAGIGILAYLYRFLIGLTVTNLSNQYPWGLWISIDVATGVALAAGGFTTAALAHIFHREKYHVIVRPALLTAMLGYTFVAIGITADLGRFYNIWHPMLPGMWSGHSVLFEVAVCVMIYMSVLYIEFVPIAVERFKGKVNLPGPLAVLNRFFEFIILIAEKTLCRFISLFIIAGVVLSCMHQSSLGTLMIIAPTKIHPLWYTNISPLLFLISAIAVGFPMVVFESLIAARSFKLKPEVDVLSSLARYIPFLLGVYLGIRVVDFTIREVWPYVFDGSTESFMFLIETVFGVIIPLVLLSIDRIRKSVGGLFISACLVIVGVALNRVNAYLVAYNPLYPGKSYFPSIIEFAVTIGLISLLVLIYRAIVMIFPVISQPAEAGTQRSI